MKTLALLSLMGMAALGCGQAPSTKTAPIEGLDDLGKSVRLQAPAQRIVSTNPAATEILYALGLGPRIVGVSRYCDYPAEATKIQKVGDLMKLDAETIVALKPDLILGTHLAQAQAMDGLGRLGFPVAVLFPSDLAGVARNIRLVARLAGVSEAGEKVASDFEGRIKRVRDRSAALPMDQRPAVFVEVSPPPIHAVGPGSFMHEILSVAGAINVFADLQKPFELVAPETVLARDPDVAIILHGVGDPDPVTSFQNRPGFSSLKAVKNRRVIGDLPENLFLRAGPRLAEGAELLFHRLHPDAPAK